MMTENLDPRAKPDIDWPAVPAYPGFRVLQVFADKDGELTVEEHHVIAWRIPPIGGFPMPVTLTDVPDAHCVIQSPTDRIIVQSGDVYANRDDWLVALKEMQAAEREGSSGEVI